MNSTRTPNPATAKHDTRALRPPVSTSASHPGELLRCATEPVARLLTASFSPSRFAANFRSVHEPQALLCAADFCVFEVNNGGFAQLFFNLTGVMAPEAVRGLQMLDLGQLAQLMEQAMSTFGTRYPRSSGARRETLETLTTESESDPFALLNRLFWKSPGSADFRQHADAYVARNLSEFFQLT